MGFLRKITGQQAQIDQQARNADAQIAATQQAAADSANAAIQQARQVAENTALVAQRDAANQQAQDALSTPLDTADVQLQADTGLGVAAGTRKRKAKFGQNYTSGVTI